MDKINRFDNIIILKLNRIYTHPHTIEYKHYRERSRSLPNYTPTYYENNVLK